MEELDDLVVDDRLMERSGDEDDGRAACSLGSGTVVDEQSRYGHRQEDDARAESAQRKRGEHRGFAEGNTKQRVVES